ncbi:MAG: Pyruvate ferredoxin oxidoreductase beta subunit [Candidatus Falkowbacteria bacterium GW2011_GWA2_39_24]|uniref:Pyruvate ferredoxin oxidoreductase beta subunit n=1 Tax=Candidatus Falkowbacteria bacterium GW2011_GWA2_39_24 TaxID=1618634 RepID=A0A0G0NFF6_9BACT|nr:MAG: Pyruvate ferredoxin oxidoreductase beta subunit [Candidatus Falkowbacteria bacterium GW2011_GWA2_39_24]
MTNLLGHNHTACLGCGQIIAARVVINALGKDTIITQATGCLEVTTAQYPNSAWGVAWLHSLFGNPSAVASGILAALQYQQGHKEDKTQPTVVVQAGDGSTFDIGFGTISGMWSRYDDILYICYDNEIYANTGMQASAASPLGANTSTSPVGLQSLGMADRKKNMLDIALAYQLPYVAQSTAGYLDDIAEKIKKALTIKGPKYIQILSPCIPGWQIAHNQALQLGKLAADTGLYPIVEYINGKLTKVHRVPKPHLKVETYLQEQKRFQHLFKTTQGKKIIKEIQKIADENIKKYGL